MLQKQMICAQEEKYDNNEEVSRVLLVCIYDTVALDITNNVVYDKFCKFGLIIKILIFDKGEVTKLFVEFQERQHAMQAKKALDCTKLLGAICRMNIYYSNFTNVDLKNDTTQGADFSEHTKRSEEYFKRYEALSKENVEDVFENAFQNFPARAKTDDPNHLGSRIHQVIKMEPSAISQEEELDHHISNGIINLLEAKSNSSNRVPTESSAARINPTMRIRQEAQNKTSILGFVINHSLKVRHLYNLFSNFGNISFISIKKNRAYVKFRTLQFSAIAHTYLNDHLLMGNKLCLQPPVSNTDAMPMEGEFCECVYYDLTFDRFTANRSITVNSPSQTLHVSSLKRQICREQSLLNIFSAYGRVEAIKILCQTNEKNMALVKYGSIESSFEAIAELHNEVFNGRKMQISFTKSKL